MSSRNITLDKSWTLFLDRDGVINKKLPGDYVKSWSEFEFLPGVIDAFRIFSDIFAKIIIVTNQQGIGKGIMTEEHLCAVHNELRSELEKAGGRVDAIYFSPYLSHENHPSRKPSTGMADLAKKEFPEINFEKSIMVGDSVKDMEFGKKLNMRTVFIKGDPDENPDDLLVDYYKSSLIEFASSL